MRPAALLARLERARAAFGGDQERVKLTVLAALERARLATADQLLRLHDTLCFLRAPIPTARACSPGWADADRVRAPPRPRSPPRRPA
jgi:hypothetical protein